METIRQLERTQLLDDLGWYDASRDIVERGYDLGLVAERYGHELACAVVTGYLTVNEIRAGVSWASSVDRQVAELYEKGYTQLGFDDQMEAAARRLAHHSGRQALRLVGKSDQLLAFTVRSGLLKKQR